MKPPSTFNVLTALAASIPVAPVKLNAPVTVVADGFVPSPRARVPSVTTAFAPKAFVAPLIFTVPAPRTDKSPVAVQTAVAPLTATPPPVVEASIPVVPLTKAIPADKVLRPAFVKSTLL